MFVLLQQKFNMSNLKIWNYGKETNKFGKNVQCTKGY